jgi:archaellum component FlaC
MEGNGKKEAGMILQKLQDIDENVKELKNEMKYVREETILQREKIRNIEIQSSENNKQIKQIGDGLWGIRVQLAGIAVIAGLVGTYISGIISKVIGGD